MLLDSPRAHLEVLKTAGVGPLTVRAVPPTLEGNDDDGGGGDDDDDDDGGGGLFGAYREPLAASWGCLLGASWETPEAS